jgi:hypothetical protein
VVFTEVSYSVALGFSAVLRAKRSVFEAKSWDFECSIAGFLLIVKELLGSFVISCPRGESKRRFRQSSDDISVTFSASILDQAAVLAGVAGPRFAVWVRG